MLLKADLHIHFKNEPQEKNTLGLNTPEWLLKKAYQYNFNAIAFSAHGFVFKDKNIDKLAKKLNIILIRASESYYKDKHILIYGIEDVPKYVDDEDLKNLKRDGALIVLPHPFLSRGTSLGFIFESIDKGLIDAIELTHFSSFFFNINKKARTLANKNSIPLIAGSDTHAFFQFNSAYSFIKTTRYSKKAIFKAIKEGAVIPKVEPLSPFNFAIEVLWEIGNQIKRKKHLTNL